MAIAARWWSVVDVVEERMANAMLDMIEHSRSRPGQVQNFSHAHYKDRIIGGKGAGKVVAIAKREIQGQ